MIDVEYQIQKIGPTQDGGPTTLRKRLEYGRNHGNSFADCLTDLILAAILSADDGDGIRENFRYAYDQIGKAMARACRNDMTEKDWIDDTRSWTIPNQIIGRR